MKHNILYKQIMPRPPLLQSLNLTNIPPPPPPPPHPEYNKNKTNNIPSVQQQEKEKQSFDSLSREANTKTSY